MRSAKRRSFSRSSRRSLRSSFKRRSLRRRGRVTGAISAGVLPFSCLLSQTEADQPNRSALWRKDSGAIKLSCFLIGNLFLRAATLVWCGVVVREKRRRGFCGRAAPYLVRRLYVSWISPRANLLRAQAKVCTNVIIALERL